MQDTAATATQQGFPQGPSSRARPLGRLLAFLMGCFVLLTLPFAVWFGAAKYQLWQWRKAAADDYRVRRDSYQALIRKISSLPPEERGNLKRFSVSGTLDPSALREGADASSIVTEGRDGGDRRYLESYHDESGRLIVRFLHRHVGGFIGSFWILYTDQPGGFHPETFGLRYSPSDQLDPNWWVVETR